MRARLALVVAVATVAAVLPGLVGPASVPGFDAAQAEAATRTYGSGPRADILHWADQKKCGGLTRDTLAAMMVTPTFTETGATGANAPGPMTLSRWDTQSALYAFGTKGFADKAFFHPGIGMWQFDSAGFWPLTAATAIYTFTSAEQAASVMASRYCASTQTDPVKKRQYAWAPWYYCTSGTLCEGVYQSVLANGILDLNTANVSSLGGMELRTCDVVGIGTVACGYVDPAKAQGYAAWAIPGFGPSPVSAPFYVLEANGREYRYWLAQDTGYGQTIRADKPVTANARTSLVWSYSETLCDKTAGRGTCAATGWTAPSATGLTTAGGIAVNRNVDGRLEAFAVGTDGQLWHRWQTVAGSGWTGWWPMGGSLATTATPTVALSPDGRQEVFVRGADGSVRHIHQMSFNGAWSSWAVRGGPISTNIVVGHNADGRMEWFARGTFGDLVHSYQVGVNSPWSWPASLGGAIAAGTEPAVATDAGGRMKLVTVDPSGMIRSRTQTWPNNAFGPTETMGGPFPTVASPTIGTNADGRLEVFAVGPFALLLNSWQMGPGSAGYAPFEITAGYFAAGPTVVTDATGRMNVFVPSWFGGVVTQVRQQAPNSPWAAPAPVGGAGKGRIAAGVDTDGRVEVLYTDATGRVYTMAHVSPPT